MKSRVGRSERKKPFYQRKSFGYTLLFFALMIFAGAGYYFYSFYNFAQSISKSNVKTKSTGEWTGTERVNIAMIGVDTRPGEGPPRSDTMMIVSIDPQTKETAMFSVMRDTYYEIPGYGRRKINEAHALGGPDLVVNTLSKYLELPIHYYVKTDFKGFASIVDVLGGIDMYVEKDMYWYDDGINDIDLKKGQQHLDGKHALMYVRFRNDAMSDYSRTERQRKLLSAFASEMKTTSSFLKLPEILKSVQDDIETDMSFNDMLKLGKLAYNLDINTMDSIQLPPFKDSTGTKEALFETIRNGASVIIPDVYETRLLVHKTLNTGKIIVKKMEDQEPMVHQMAAPKPSPTATPPIPKTTDGKNSGTATGSSGTKTGDKTKSDGLNTGGTSTGNTNTGGSSSGTSTGGNTTGGTTTGGTNSSGTTGSGTGGSSGTSTGGSGTSTGGSGGGTTPIPPPITVTPPTT